MEIIKKSEYLWYLSYGSNLSLKRFLCYIKGGKPELSDLKECGCRNSSHPIKEKEIIINNELIFVGKSKRWSNQGVAIINPEINKNKKTYGKMYLIKKDQFIDVIKQENGIMINNDLVIDFPEPIEGNQIDLFKNEMYGKIYTLGTYLDYPIYTFTSSIPLDILEINKPSKEYIQMISKGIDENFNVKIEDLVNYFINLKGINGFYSLKQLKDIISKVI